MTSETASKGQSSAPALAFGTVALGIFGVIALVVALVTGMDNDNGTSVATGAPKTVDVVLTEFAVTPAEIDVPAGTDLTLNVTNNGAVPHDLAVASGTPKLALLAPGQSGVLHVGPVASETEVLCTVPGHKEAGMVLKINTTGSSSATASDHDGTTAVAAGSSSDGATIDPNATPGPEWKPYDPVLAPAPGGTEHQVTFHAGETQLEVAPGVMQEMWTFNGTVPGPVLRGKVGDIFTVTLVNDGKVGHSIDFHASQTSMNVDMRTLQPGESLVYQFQAQYSGIWMYHCGTPPVLHHIGNGMYGAVIIDPPDLAPVNQEYLMVQSELYLGPDGQAGSLTKMAADNSDAVVFNGYHNQYKSSPIRVEPGQRIRVWVLDAGPNDISSFHIVGTIFDTVYKEGAYLVRPGNAQQGASQVLDLTPAQGGFAELTFAKPGMYAMVTHKFADASKGALGVFQAGPEQPAAEG